MPRKLTAFKSAHNNRNATAVTNCKTEQGTSNNNHRDTSKQLNGTRRHVPTLSHARQPFRFFVGATSDYFVVYDATECKFQEPQKFQRMTCNIRDGHEGRQKQQSYTQTDSLFWTQQLFYNLHRSGISDDTIASIVVCLNGHDDRRTRIVITEALRERRIPQFWVYDWHSTAMAGILSWIRCKPNSTEEKEHLTVLYIFDNFFYAYGIAKHDAWYSINSAGTFANDFSSEGVKLVKKFDNKCKPSAFVIYVAGEKLRHIDEAAFTQHFKPQEVQFFRRRNDNSKELVDGVAALVACCARNPLNAPRLVMPVCFMRCRLNFDDKAVVKLRTYLVMYPFFVEVKVNVEDLRTFWVEYNYNGLNSNWKQLTIFPRPLQQKKVVIRVLFDAHGICTLAVNDSPSANCPSQYRFSRFKLNPNRPKKWTQLTPIYQKLGLETVENEFKALSTFATNLQSNGYGNHARETTVDIFATVGTPNGQSSRRRRNRRTVNKIHENAINELSPTNRHINGNSHEVVDWMES